MNNFDEDFYMATLRTADTAGLAMTPKFRAAQLMAIVYVWGWGDEIFTSCPKLLCDIKYIQQKYHIEGGEPTDDPEFIQYLKDYTKELEDYIKQKEHTNDGKIPEWATKLMNERYGFIMKDV